MALLLPIIIGDNLCNHLGDNYTVLADMEIPLDGVHPAELCGWRLISFFFFCCFFLAFSFISLLSYVHFASFFLPNLFAFQ